MSERQKARIEQLEDGICELLILLDDVDDVLDWEQRSNRNEVREI